MVGLRVEEFPCWRGWVRTSLLSADYVSARLGNGAMQ